MSKSGVDEGEGGGGGVERISLTGTNATAQPYLGRTPGRGQSAAAIIRASRMFGTARAPLTTSVPRDAHLDPPRSPPLHELKCEGNLEVQRSRRSRTNTCSSAFPMRRIRPLPSRDCPQQTLNLWSVRARDMTWRSSNGCLGGTPCEACSRRQLTTVVSRIEHALLFLAVSFLTV